jgi:hypothetical protein
MTTIEIPAGIDPIDLEALKLAFEKCRASSKARHAQIDSMLADRSWEDVAEFCAYGQQVDSLHLKPWQTPPCWVEDAHEPKRGEEEAAKLLRRMLRSGVSRWHLDPLAALEKSEKT